MASFCNAAIGEKMRALNGVFLIARGIFLQGSQVAGLILGAAQGVEAALGEDLTFQVTLGPANDFFDVVARCRGRFQLPL